MFEPAVIVASIAVLGALTGWIYNNVINRRLEENKAFTKKAFERYDELEERISKEYVRLDLYKQALEFIEKNNDDKLKGLFMTMTTQFTNLEKKMDDFKGDIKEAIRDLKQDNNHSH